MNDNIPMNEKENMGGVIRRLRMERDWTQEELAARLGVSGQAVSKWETGQSLPDISQVPTLARTFGVTTDEISVSDIRLINEPAGYHTELSTRTVRVKVRGSTDEIREIKSNASNGIYVLVDLAEYSQTGVFTVSGRVVNETHPAVSVAETVEIGVEISAQTPDLTPPPEE